jgi:hypothetical protein
MLATIDVPQIEECRRLMDFGRDVVRKLLSDHMFGKAKDKKAKIDKIVDTLSSVKQFKVHGRFINGNYARRELSLKVKLLARDELFWKKVWEYYTRAEITLKRSGGDKLFETKHEVLIGKMRSA